MYRFVHFEQALLMMSDTKTLEEKGTETGVNLHAYNIYKHKKNSTTTYMVA